MQRLTLWRTSECWEKVKEKEEDNQNKVDELSYNREECKLKDQIRDKSSWRKSIYMSLRANTEVTAHNQSVTQSDLQSSNSH